MSIKLDRIESNMIKEISYILANEVKDKDIKFVTVTECRVTNDLSYAKVYYTVLNMDKKEETAKALKNAAGFIRKELMNRMDIRYTPELEFIFDESIEYGKKIENLIDEIHNKDIEK